MEVMFKLSQKAQKTPQVLTTRPTPRVVGAAGSICTNGSPRDLRQFRKLSRYIMQEDLLQPLITVQEAMAIAADLKLGSEMTRTKKRVVVSIVLGRECDCAADRV